MSNKQNPATPFTMTIDMGEAIKAEKARLHDMMKSQVTEVVRTKINDMFRTDTIVVGSLNELTPEMRSRMKNSRPYDQRRHLVTLHPKAIAPVLVALDEAATKTANYHATQIPAMYEELYKEALVAAIKKKAEHDANKRVFSGRPPQTTGS